MCVIFICIFLLLKIILVTFLDNLYFFSRATYSVINKALFPLKVLYPHFAYFFSCEGNAIGRS